MPTGQSVCGISSDARANPPLACKAVAGAGVVPVEDDDAVIVGFGSRKVRILSPFGRLTKL